MTMGNIELENYSYKKDKHTNEYTNVPVDAFNHLLDAMRYGIQIVSNDKKMKIGSKAKLGLWKEVITLEIYSKWRTNSW